MLIPGGKAWFLDCLAAAAPFTVASALHMERASVRRSWTAGQLAIATPGAPHCPRAPADPLPTLPPNRCERALLRSRCTRPNPPLGSAANGGHLVRTIMAVLS